MRFLYSYFFTPIFDKFDLMHAKEDSVDCKLPRFDVSSTFPNLPYKVCSVLHPQRKKWTVLTLEGALALAMATL
jgi:hypothetical protein